MHSDTVLAALRDGETAVTANNRLARNIKLGYNRHQRAQGLKAWNTPHVVPWAIWIGELWSQAVAHGGEAGRRTLLTDAQAGALWRDIVREAGLVALPGTAAPVAELASRAWRLVQNWRLTPATLMAAADSDDSHAFAMLAAAFQRRCDRDGWADASALLPLLAVDAQRGKLGHAGKIHLIGFDDWTPAQRELLRVMSGTGWTVTEVPAPRAATTNACQIKCGDKTSELELAARWARGRMERDPGALIGIVVPDLAIRVAEARRAILDVFSPGWRLTPAADMPVNFSCGEPLAHTGLVHAALLALQALSGEIDYRDAGQLLRTPYLRGSSAEAETRARLDLSLRERIGMVASVTELAARAKDKAPLLGAQLLALATVAAAIPHRQSASAWADTFRDALRAVGWPGDRPLGPDEYQAGTAWQEQLDALRGCERITGALSLDGAVGLIRSLAQDQIFQAAGHPDAVQVLGVLEAIGQRFDALWVCGVTSAAWPPAVAPDPLIPLAVQRDLRMPDSSPPAARERAERLLRWLEGSASEVVVSWAAFSGDEPLSPSPLIAHLPIRSANELKAWNTPGWRTSMVASRSLELLSTDPAPPVDPAHPPRGGATLLERQARCPARAFIEFRLGARELKTPSAGIDAAMRGAITHGVLQDFFIQVPTHSQLGQMAEAEQTALLDSIIRRRLDKELPMSDPLVRRIAQHERERLQLLLRTFLQQERERQPFEVIATETELAPEIAALPIKVRADRIDRLVSGEHLIIDYKTGSSLPPLGEWCGPRPRSPQLPLYATVADAQGIAFVHLTVSGVAWRVLGTDSLPVSARVRAAEVPGNHAGWEDLRAEWQSALERLAREILAGDFRIDRWHRREAEGQWAMATRVHELADDEERDS